jgi:hypothetical protein
LLLVVVTECVLGLERGGWEGGGHILRHAEKARDNLDCFLKSGLGTGRRVWSENGLRKG